MIAAAVLKTTHWWQQLSVSWFDVVVLLVLAFGFWRGRKRGMSREALPTAFWLVAVIGAGFGHAWLGDMIVSTGYVRQLFGTGASERTIAYVFSYLAIVLVAFIFYSMLAKVFREKVSGSNAFGGGEYYLGIIAGIIRYACILIFFLALINAPYYSGAEIAAQKAYNNRWYGGGLQGYDGNFIPSFAEIQTSIFRTSISGPVIQNNLGALLIESAAPVYKRGGHH